MATLFAHQKAGLEIGIQGNKAFFWDCGCGKSCLSLNLIREYKARGIGPALVVCPVSIIRSAWLADAKQFTPELEVVDLHDRFDKKRGKLIERTAKNRLALLEADGIDVYVLNYELLKGLYPAILKRGFKVLTVDECFVGDTLVDTETGPKPIDTIKAGERVWNCLGLSRVKSVTKRYVADDSLVLTTIHGVTVISSMNHPYLTYRGWVKAKNLRKGDHVISTGDSMRMVQEAIDSGTSTKPFEGKKEKTRQEGFLQSVLFSEMENEQGGLQEEFLYNNSQSENKPICKEIHEIRAPGSGCQNGADTHIESDEQPGNESQGFEDTQANGTLSSCTVGQWHGTNCTSKNTCRIPSGKISSICLGNGTCCKAERTTRGVSNQLQDRYCESVSAIRDRGGRLFPQSNSQTGGGSKEGRETGGIRVENTSIYKSDNPIFDRYRDERNRIVLYDLEIEGHPSFSVNGILVHNSSKMKDPTSQITRCLLALAGIKTRAKRGVGFKVADPPIPHRYCLSGTPAPNSFEEYWGQIKFIAGPGRAFHDNVTAFRSRYFHSEPIGNTGAVRRTFIPAFQDEFMARIQKYAHVVKKEDAVDLPEQTHLVRRVTLSAAERAAYDTFKNEMVLRFADSTVLSTNALVEIMKLRQLAGGWIYDSDGTAHKTGDSKLRELKDLLAEIGSRQVIIWANYKTEFEHLMAELPGSGTLYSGTADREGTIQAFKAGKIQYLIANPASAGHGLTFVNCSDAVYYSLSHSYELLKQSQDRIHRIGQRNACTYHYLLAAGTIDAAIYRVLRQKGDVSNAVLNYLRDSQEGNFDESETELNLVGCFE